MQRKYTFGTDSSSGLGGGTYGGILKPKNNFPKGKLRGAGFFPSFSRSSFTITRCWLKHISNSLTTYGLDSLSPNDLARR
jgi:hypothetical protein